MRNIARRYDSSLRLSTTAIAAMAVAAGVLLGAPAALAVPPAVTVKTSFENSPVSLNTSDAVGFAITNNTGSSQTVSFTDTLPNGVTLDDPIALNTAPGSGLSASVCSNVTATQPGGQNPSAPGDNAVTVSATVASETNGTVCTVSFGVVAATPSVGDAPFSDTYSDLSPNITRTTPGSLIVLTSPSLTVAAPANGQRFALAQIVDANFACAATDPLDVVDSFFGTDDEGNQIEAGAPLDTVDPGTRTLEIDCYSAAGGGVTSQTVTYTVGSYALRSVKVARKTDSVSFKTLVPAGKLVAKVIDGKKVLWTSSWSVASQQTESVTLKPKAAALRVLHALKGRSVKVKLQVSFTPAPIGTGDAEIAPAEAIILTRNVTLPLAHALSKK